MDYLNQPSHLSESIAVVTNSNGSSDSLQLANIASSPRYSFENEDDSESEATLLQYWRILRRYKATIILSALAGLILGFSVGIPMKPVYRARTSLEVLSINEDFLNMKQANPTTTNTDSSDTSEEQTQAKLLKSEGLLNRVFVKLDPDAVLAPRRAIMARSGWRSWLHLPEPVRLTEREKLLRNASSSLKVTPTLHTRVLEVSVDSKDSQLAADFANTLVREFIQQNLEARRSTTQGTSEWLQLEIDGARAKLQTSEDALQAYARESGLIFTQEDTNVQTEKLQQVQQELSNATADRIAKQARFELARTSPPDSLADVLSDDGLQDLESKFVDLRRQVAALAAVFNPGYSKLQAAQAELAAAQQAFEQRRDDIVKRVENDYQQATSNEKLLASAYDAQTKEVTGQSEKAIQYNILKREVEGNRLLYDTMLQETKHAAIAAAMRASNVRVVDRADPPDRPVFPNFPLNSALGLFAGLFMSVVFVTIRERSDRTLQHPGDVKLWTNLSELGTIPKASARTEVYSKRSDEPLDGDSRMGRALRLRGGHTQVELMTWRNKPSAVAEAFRSVLTSILFVGENGSRPRVLVFTSASPGEGKTTVVSNLAIAIAEIRRKVVIIDADLRRPRMHDVFSLPNERGLTDLLREEFSEASVGALVQQTAIPGVRVLTAGPATQAAAHWLYSPHFAALVTTLKKEYDMILVDTPPMLQMTDARVAGRLADAVVVVARADKTTRDSLLAVRDRFAEDRIRILGAILNDWNPQRSPNGYYANYNGYSYVDSSGRP
jgi:succinoglycan biosynthesis transport protein ExoP